MSGGCAQWWSDIPQTDSSSSDSSLFSTGSAVAEVVEAPPVEEVEDADRAEMLLFFKAVLAFARQIVGLKAEDTGGTARAAVVVVL